MPKIYNELSLARGQDVDTSQLDSKTKPSREPIVALPKKPKKVTPRKVKQKYVSSPSESKTELVLWTSAVELSPA